jgi:kinesin family member 2/24
MDQENFKLEKRTPSQPDKFKEKIRNQKDQQAIKREQYIDGLDAEELLQELKNKALPTYGTKQERADRLKKANGIPLTENNSNKKNNVLSTIEAISKKREERRKKIEEEKFYREGRRLDNESQGKNADIVFFNMINQYRTQVPVPSPHTSPSSLRICVCIRKRPIFSKEESQGEIDSISCSNPKVLVHEPKLKVDGITKYLENHTFIFDNTFSEMEDNFTVYQYSLKPLCPFIANGGTVTCFAYGQTGSGKTFTMKGLQSMVAQDLFLSSSFTFYVSFFEIYGGRCFDLLNERCKLSILEDGNGNIQVQGLMERSATNKDELLNIIDYGNSIRTTRSTTSNEDSSRSHAVCQISLKQNNKTIGKLRLVDLAGSERAQDCISNNRQRRIEGAEINKSLLALKECIRALRKGPDAHVPYRGSKLTLVLRDSFEGSDDKKVLMIACISPGHSSSDHSLNSLRYADRLKEQSLGNVVNQFLPKNEPRKPTQPSVKKINPPRAASKDSRPSKDPKKPPETQERQEKLGKSFKDMEYIHNKNSEEEKIGRELLDLHEKVETIIEEEEELLEIHVSAIKEDAKILTKEGELIALVQSDGDYEIDSYVDQMEALIKQKLKIYKHLYDKIITFKAHLNEEEDISNHLTQNFKQHK